MAPCVAAGRHFDNLYDIIEDWDLIASGLSRGTPVERLDDVEILAPLVGRDVIAIAKNYRDHVK